LTEGKYAPFNSIETMRSCRNIANVFRQFRLRPRTPRRSRAFSGGGRRDGLVPSLPSSSDRVTAAYGNPRKS